MNKKIIVISALALTISLTGCKTGKTNTHVSSSHANEVQQLRAELDSKNQELSRVQGILNNQASVEVSTIIEDTMLPPNAKAGECYARVLIPATYRTVTKDIIKSKESTKIEIIPATYETVTKQVLVKEAGETLTTIPAVYDWVEEQVLVTAESTKIQSYPAEYGTESEQILVKPAYTTWEKGRGPIEKIDGSTGEIMCLVEIPAEYKTVTTRVVTVPARTETTVIPAVYKAVKKKVMVKPPQIVRNEIPAVYDAIEVTKVATPSRENVVNIPAVYDTVVQQEQVTGAEMQWRPILCETNTTSDIIHRIQKALDKAGYSPGNIDGVLGGTTMNALSQFQKDNGLSSGQLTMTTLKKLGVL